MTEYEKMLHNLPYDYMDKEVQANILRAYYAMRDLNQCGAWDMDELHRCIRALIPDAHPSVIICPPFHCDHGNRISIGEGSFVNFNGVFLDGGGITIGAHTLIGPNCQLLTPDHPHDYMARRQTIETGRPIRIGDDCWLGGGVIVCPGVTIGNRVIVGAGSVVTHDIPDDVVIAGNPARIIKKNDVSGELNSMTIDTTNMCSHLQRKLFDADGEYSAILKALEIDPTLTAVVRSRQLHIYRDGKKILILAGKSAPKIIRDDKLTELL